MVEAVDVNAGDAHQLPVARLGFGDQHGYATGRFNIMSASVH